MSPSYNKASRLSIIVAALAILAYFASLQFSFATFLDPDSYYNIAVSRFIKESGFHYQFHWAQLSTLKDSFSDRDLLLHILNIPFLYLCRSDILAGKCAVVFYAALFICVYLYVLRKYLPDFWAAVFLLLPFSSWIFSSYFLELRSVTLANILLISGIYCIINKKFLWVFLISFLYALGHTSFFLLILFALICEALRWLGKEGFSRKNIYAVLAGAVSGCLIHPNFPHNLFNLYLNGILVPLYTFAGIDIGFSGETKALGLLYAVINNLALILALIMSLCAAIFTKKKMSLASRMWLYPSLVCLGLALISMRYWYQANALFFVFFASYARDWLKNKSGKVLIALYLVIVAALFPFSRRQLMRMTAYLTLRNSHYEDVGRWMRKHIPAGKTIYHSYWDDAAYFLCFNPKDNYLNINDPIYMFYRYPRELEIINNLSLGRVGNPAEVISRIFKADYGYVRKQEPLYRQIKEKPGYFKILYEDGEGAVFTIL
jgi:hypothetical protein